MVLHPVPNRNCPRQPGVYFWRSPDGDWAHSEQGPGFASLESLVQEYENKVVVLSNPLAKFIPKALERVANGKKIAARMFSR